MSSTASVCRVMGTGFIGILMCAASATKVTPAIISKTLRKRLASEATGHSLFESVVRVIATSPKKRPRAKALMHIKLSRAILQPKVSSVEKPHGFNTFDTSTRMAGKT